MHQILGSLVIGAVAAEGARNAGDSGTAPLGSVPFTQGTGGNPAGSTVGGAGTDEARPQDGLIG